MKKNATLLTLPAMILLFSCMGPEREEKLVQELMEADREFSELSRMEGMNEAFVTFCHPEGVLLRPNSQPVQGRNQVAELLQKNDDSGFQLTWEPLFASVARSGDLGYTYGTFELMVKATGEVQRGTYVSIWKKTDQGWRFVLDTGNEGLGS
jgi:ketosteroid isomerase-like protein